MNNRIRVERLPNVVVYYDTWHNRPVLTAMRTSTGYMAMVNPKYERYEEVRYFDGIDSLEASVEMLMRGQP